MKEFTEAIGKVIVGIVGVFTVITVLSPWQSILEKVVYVAGFVVIAAMMMFIVKLLNGEKLL